MADQLRAVAILRLLTEIGYRSRSVSDARWQAAKRLEQAGFDADAVDMLWRYAQDCGERPMGLFDHWIRDPRVAIRKLDEMRSHGEWVRRQVDDMRRNSAKIISLSEWKKISGL